MSTYGRLWQQVSDIRDELKRFGVIGSTLADARKAAVTVTGGGSPTIVRLLGRWEQCEKEMEFCDETTSEP